MLLSAIDALLSLIAIQLCTIGALLNNIAMQLSAIGVFLRTIGTLPIKIAIDVCPIVALASSGVAEQ